MRDLLQPVHPFWQGDVPEFENEYDRIVAHAYNLREERPHAKLVGAIRAPRRCAVCERTEPQATFKTDAHLIAACLGNRSLFSREECDACNLGKGRSDEDELGKMLLPHRAIGRVRTREGTAKLKQGREASVGGGAFDGPLPIVLHPADDTIRLEHKANSTAELRMRAPGFRPARALLSLLRSVWLSMDDPTRARHTWLRSMIAGDPRLGRTEYFEFFQQGAWDMVLLEAWERRTSSTCATAPLIVRLAFVNTILVWCSPNPDTFEHSPSLLPPLGDRRPVASRFIRLADVDARVSDRTVMFTISYKERIQGSQSPDPIAPKPLRKPPVCLEFEWAGGNEKLRETFVVKGNLEAARPYFELKGGALAGWIAIQLPSPEKVNVRFEYQPHLASPEDALATFHLLTALGEPGRLRLRNVTNGHDIIAIQQTATEKKVPLLDICEFLRDLATINRELQTDLRVPAPPAKLPLREAGMLAAAITYGRVAEKPKQPLRMTMPAALARETVSLIRLGVDLASENEMPLELLGTPIDVGSMRLVMVRPRLPSDPANCEEELASKPPDETVELEVDCALLVREYERWRGRRPELPIFPD